MRFQVISSAITCQQIISAMMNQCIFCHKKIKAAKQLFIHETKCELYGPFIQEESDGSFKCKKCFRNFENQRQIFTHMKVKHFVGIPLQNVRKCQRCFEPFDKNSKHEPSRKMLFQHFDRELRVTGSIQV